MLMLCKACGWIEQPKQTPTKTSTATKGLLAGIKATFWLLGGTITVLGYYFKTVGAVCVAFGMASWWVLGFGLILAGLGWIAIQISKVLVATGRMLRPGVGGVQVCPSCRSEELIPTTSPLACKKMMELDITPPLEPENTMPFWQRFLSYSGGLLMALGLVVWLPYKIFFASNKPANYEPMRAAAQVKPQITPAPGKNAVQAAFLDVSPSPPSGSIAEHTATPAPKASVAPL